MVEESKYIHDTEKPEMGRCVGAIHNHVGGALHILDLTLSWVLLVWLRCLKTNAIHPENILGQLT